MGPEETSIKLPLGTIGAVGKERDSGALNSVLGYPFLRSHRGHPAPLQGPVDSCWGNRVQCVSFQAPPCSGPHTWSGQVRSYEWVAQGAREEGKGPVDVS